MQQECASHFQTGLDSLSTKPSPQVIKPSLMLRTSVPENLGNDCILKVEHLTSGPGNLLREQWFQVTGDIVTVKLKHCVWILKYIKPVIACGDTKLKQFLDEHCPISKEKFWPTWWAFEGRMQTVLRSLLQSQPHMEYTGEYIKCPDGGVIKLDWVENDDHSRTSKDLRPTILLLPGLTGNSSESYILHMVEDATAMGYRSVVFNNRGTCGTPLKTPRTYCASKSDDTALVIDHIKKRYPDAPLMGIGISLGGMILFNYMAHYGSTARLCAAMCFSVNWNVFKGIESLETPINYHLFNRVLAKALCGLVEMHSDVLEKHEDLEIPHILKSQTIRDFDERFTSKVFGYESLDHYYEDASLHTKIHALGKPVVCLSAGDDPFSPAHSVPLKDAETNDNIAIVLTSHGGHIGFLEGTLPRHRSYMYRWMRQFVPAMFEHGIKSL
ncbi:abhydrolase domain-containing protein 3 [Plakobranchus ocellatus]|uniref:Phospholipase ABHD3 n=1 Tax=Plakobranchus ocellatus TaxID=259542 RepID=A0AAV4CST0_9GAST|nr:abhydrolase domain-containing protein 3 [Plakobranchus ocellatus]